MIRQITRRIPFLANRLPSFSMFSDLTQYKYIYAWFKSNRKNYLLDHAIPWLTYDAVIFLEEHLKEGSQVFEYGSGASTLFWAKHKADCTSVEHDAGWYEIVKNRLDPRDDIDLRLVPPDPLTNSQPDLDVGAPENYRSSAIGYARSTFRNYVCQIDEFPDKHFDIVLIDGRARASCIVHSITKVKAGGMLILDNADIPRHLARTSHYLENFKLHSFFGIGPIQGTMFQTNIYMAP
jgi:hypothetical protein